MSYLTLNSGAAPSVPAAGKVSDYYDSADKSRKYLNEQGFICKLGNRDAYNYIRNSGMWWARKQVPATATTFSNTTGRTQTADGWGVTNETASMTFARVDTNAAPETGLQSRFYGTALKTTATGKIIMTQALFGTDVCNLRGRTVRVQLWVKVPTGTPLINLALIQLNSSGTVDTPPGTFISAFGGNAVDPTLGTNLAYIAPKAGVTNDNCTTDGNHVELTASTTWQRFGAVFDVPVNCKNLFVMIYGDSQFTTTNGFSFSQVSLTDGYEIQDWAPMDRSAERDRLTEIRKTFNDDTGPAQNVGLNTGEFKFMGTVAGALAMAGIGMRWDKPLRAAATVSTLYNPSVANAQVRNVTDSVDMTGSTITANGEQGFWINCTGAAGNAAGEHLAVHVLQEAFM